MDAMNPVAVLQIVTKALEQAGIPYMITGSFASNYYGMSRSTADIDFVIAADPDQLQMLVQQLQEKGYYSQVDDALDAWRHNSMFNVIDDSMVWKIDFIMRKPGVFSRGAFQRRIPGDIQGIPVVISTAEDLIIAKLDWAKQGESQRQIEDVAGILKMKPESLDRSYIDKWVADLELTVQWNSAKQAAGFE
jgi:hypothetical protein